MLLGAFLIDCHGSLLQINVKHSDVAGEASSIALISLF